MIISPSNLEHLDSRGHVSSLAGRRLLIVFKTDQYHRKYTHVWVWVWVCVCLACLLQVCKCLLYLTVATILLTAAADSSSPLGCSTIVTPRYLSWNTMPSRRVSLVSVQFSGSSADERHAQWHFCSPTTPAAFSVSQANRCVSTTQRSFNPPVGW